MKNILISAAVAVATLVGSAAPSLAVTYTGEPTSLGTFSFAADGPSATVTFDNAFPTAVGAFTNTFQFEIALGTQASLEIASATNNVPLIGAWTLNLYAAAAPGSATNGSGPIGVTLPLLTITDPFSGLTVSQQLTQFAAGLSSGFYNLVLTGNVTAPDTSYGGTVNFTLAGRINEVPLPGALLLMGSVLMGGAGFARWRKNTSRLAA